jgi:hypothetical protein
MALVPRYHPLHGRPNQTLLAECVPNSPRDAWTWLAENPRLAAKSGLTSCIAGSPTHSCHVLFITPNQYSQIKDQTTLCVLCSWDCNFHSWKPSQHIVLEKNIDNRLHFRLSGIRELNTEQEVIDAQRQTETDGLVLLSEETTTTTSASESASTPSAAIPIPPRGHMKRGSSLIDPNAVLFTLTQLSGTKDEYGFY